MTAADVTIVPTGTANIASVLAAFGRIGATAVLATTPEEIRDAARVVLPGVGAFAAARASLAESGMDRALVERIASGAPMLMICLGLQLLAEGSEESPGVAGLGVIPATVRRLPDGVRLPQLGWNRVVPGAASRYLRPGHAYFANSYCLTECDPSWSPAMANHGGEFIAAIERDSQLACQFHPELSGTWGQQLIARWCASC